MMKRSIVFLCVLLIVLSGCTVPMSMDSAIKEPHFAGVVIEVYEDSILVSVNEGEEARKSSDLIDVSLNVELKDSMTDFMSGDEVVVYYDGNIAESYPAQINKVYAIVLTSPDKKDDWTDASGVDVQHILSGQTTEWTITEEQQIDDLYKWFINLSLTKKQFADGESPGDSNGGEVYSFTLHNDSNTSFSYGKYGPNECYIIYYAEWYKVENPSNPFKEPSEINPLNNSPTTSGQETNSASCIENGFEMNLFSDKGAYKSTDIIQIWATLEYIGNDDTITIWHGDPYIVFSITDGKDFNAHGFVYDILTSTALEKDKLYRFDYQKSGGWSADDPNASFWENFYNEKDLLLPEGEYTIAVRGAFSLTEKVVDSQSGLLCELKIKVE